MLDNIRRKSSQISFDLYKSILPRLYAFSPKVLKLDLGKLRLGKKATKSFRYFGQSYPFTSEVCSIENVEFQMLACPSGIFIMGHQDQEDNPSRGETIDRPFLLGETEVTQELYEAVMGTNPSSENKPENPVERVFWYDAILFCNELSKLKGLEECYKVSDITKVEGEYGATVIQSANVSWNKSKNGYRLPTEKEWEYAAKAGTNNKWAGTDNENDLKKHAVYSYNAKIQGIGQTHPVKSKLPNEWGFYDVSGNVWEWCWDKYAPKNRKISDNRVIRGGSWFHNTSALRSAYRSISSPGYRPGYRPGNVGFRVCRSIVN